MRPSIAVPYSLAAHVARAASVLAPPGGGKVLASLRARRGLRARFTAWGARARDPARPLLWVHAPSVGEGLQAQPVIAQLRALHPDLQLAYTFFSPSAASFARTIGADFADYLPFDTRGEADAALDALRPTAIVFSKLDVWPLLVERAAARGVRLGLISATFAHSAGRSSRLAALLLADAYRALDAVGAIDTADADRLVQLGVRRGRVAITGDTRYDQVWSRAHAVDRAGALLGPLASTRATLVAGSTWPSDEAPLCEAWRGVRARVPEARLIIAPHEPSEARLIPIERWAAREALRCVRLGAAAQCDALRDADVLLVDRTGVLGELYALADVAYVGGAFHAAGLHSVLEPAAFGVPVLFGPRHSGSRDARLLLECGGGFSCASTTELSRRLVELLVELLVERADGAGGAGHKARPAAGARALSLVEAGLGAADRSAALVERLLKGAATS